MKDWNIVKLEDVATLKAGKFISSKEILPKQDSLNTYPCFGGNGIRGFVSCLSHEGVFPIIGRQGALCGNVNLANGKFYATEHAVVAHPKNGNNPYWLYYTLVYSNLNQYATGQAQPGISVETINKVPILLPPIVEQKKIAETLSIWDKAIEKTENLIEAKETQKKALISNLTNNNVAEKFKLGNVVIDNSKWNRKYFNEVFEFLSTNTYSRECMSHDGGKVKNIHYGDVLVKYAEVLDVETTEIPCLKPDVDISKMTLLRSGDIVIADTAEDETVGKTVEVLNVGQNLIVSGLHTMFCRPQKNLFSPGWLGYYINSNDYHKQLIPLMAGIKVSSIAKKDIVNTTILVPSLPEQKKNC